MLHSAQNGAFYLLPKISELYYSIVSNRGVSDLNSCFAYGLTTVCGVCVVFCFGSLFREQTLKMSRSGKLRVAVLGAGAAGLCAACHILSRAEWFEPPVVFEQSARVGGTWYYEERVGTSDDGRPIHGSMYRDLRWRITFERAFTGSISGGNLSTRIAFCIKV